MKRPKKSTYWLDEVKKQLGIDSDAKLGERLEVSRAAISQMRSGKIGIGVKTAIRIGWLLKKDPLLIISSTMYNQETDRHQRAFWKAVYLEAMVKSDASEPLSSSVSEQAQQ
jgi:plasmid maintenance system antidote protein VapI